MFGLEGLIPGKTLFYTDGAGLLIVAYAQDGQELIGKVEIVKPGYATPDGRQVGDPLDKRKQTIYVKDARISFGERYQSEGDAIESITMTVALDRVWDETELDVDGDGALERLTLSGRCYGAYVEQGTVLGYSDKGTVRPPIMAPKQGLAYTRATRCMLKRNCRCISISCCRDFAISYKPKRPARYTFCAKRAARGMRSRFIA